MSDPTFLEKVLWCALLTRGAPMTMHELMALFPDEEGMTPEDIEQALSHLSERFKPWGMVLRRAALGYQWCVSGELMPWIERARGRQVPKYSRAIMETLALIAYRQPITRAEIEDIRGVAVSSSILQTLLDRQWIEVTGQKETPGRPALYGTTEVFLQDLGLHSLGDLPALEPTSLEAGLSTEVSEPALSEGNALNLPSQELFVES